MHWTNPHRTPIKNADSAPDCRNLKFHLRFLLKFAYPLLFLASYSQSASAKPMSLQQQLQGLEKKVRAFHGEDHDGVAKRETEQMRVWLNRAAIAIKKGDSKRCLNLFQWVRSQLELSQELVTLSKLRNETEKMKQKLAELRKKIEGAQAEIQEKMEYINILRTAQ